MTKNPIEFVREVRAEVAKVTWPTRRETMITTSMVFIFVVIAAVFFLVADKIIGFVVRLVLGTLMAAHGAQNIAPQPLAEHAHARTARRFEALDRAR